MRILTKKQSINLDRISIEKYNVSQSGLMISAANSIVNAVEKYSSSVAGQSRILILCGKGNNGGDAVCAARILHKRNMMFMCIF